MEPRFDGSNEFYSARMRAGRRTYFFNVKMSKKGEKYLVLNEVRNRDDGSKERTRIVIFEEDIYGFWNNFKDAIEVMVGGKVAGGDLNEFNDKN